MKLFINSIHVRKTLVPIRVRRILHYIKLGFYQFYKERTIVKEKKLNEVGFSN